MQKSEVLRPVTEASSTGKVGKVMSHRAVNYLTVQTEGKKGEGWTEARTKRRLFYILSFIKPTSIYWGLGLELGEALSWNTI